MSSLFLVMLGGRHFRANTEVHDVVFAVGQNLQDTYSQLRHAWFGEQQGLHIDAWMQINGVESQGKKYQIHFSHAAPNVAHEKLWLINLGGYDSKQFGELHRYVLVVAQNEKLAKERGKAYFIQEWQKNHTDRIVDVDDCLAVDLVGGHYIELIEGDFSANHWENDYITIA